MKNIRRKAFDMKTVRLSAEEGFVLSRLDAPLSVKDLVSLTGLDEGRIVEIVGVLAQQGALDVDRDGPAPAPAATAEVKAEPQREEPAEPEQSAEELAKQASEASDAESDPADADDPAEEEKRLEGTREYQKIYETIFHPMQRDE